MKIDITKYKLKDYVKLLGDLTKKYKNVKTRYRGNKIFIYFNQRK